MAITIQDQFGFEFIGTPNEIGDQSGRLRFTNINLDTLVNQGTVLGDSTIVTGAQAGNSKALRMVAPAANQHRKAEFTLNSPITGISVVHLVFKVSSHSDNKPADFTALFNCPSEIQQFGSGYPMTLWVNSSGNIEAHGPQPATGGSPLATGAGYVSVDEWHHLVVEFNASTDEMKVRLNGVEQFVIACTGFTQISNFGIGSATDSAEYHEFDNIVAYSVTTTNEDAGPLIVADVIPSATASNNAFTAVGDITIHQSVDEVDSDDDVTYVEGSQVNSNFFVTGNMPTFTGQLLSIEMWAEVRHTIAEKVGQLQYKTGGAANDLGGTFLTTAGYSRINRRVGNLAIPVAGANQFQFGLNKDD